MSYILFSLKIQIIHDNFENHSVGNLQSTDYKCSIDSQQSVLRPQSFEDSVDLEELYKTDEERTSNNYKNNKKHRYYVDIYIKSQNRCIEVKSQWTNQPKNYVLEKKDSAESLGYKYDLWIYDRKRNKIFC